MSRKIIEVLSPAGSEEAMVAAVRCGAAAVYFGVGDFNARRFAKNFSPDALADAVAYCHARDTRVHLTLNTLVRQDELPAALETARLACNCGVDALIVQDVGLARCIRAMASDMPLHASTQLSCHSPAGVDFLRDAGFTRVVLAREMSREEIRACIGRGVEIEVFAHGALCMSVSGQCYFSAMLGGRSGNRGQCAQTCRLPFEPTGDTPHPCPAVCAALSLKDNCLIDYVAELAAMGVCSLKIEGRMKRPEYVAAATRLYAAAAHGETVTPEQIDELRHIFSRTGFTDGYYTGKRGTEQFGTRRKEDVVAAAPILGTLERLYDREMPRVPVRMTLALSAAQSTLTVSDADGHTVCATDAGCEKAEHQPLTAERAAQQIEKTGGTPFYVTDTDIRIPDGQTVPAARLNALRRNALDQLLRERGKAHPLPVSAQMPPLSTIHADNGKRLYVRIADLAQWNSGETADCVFLPLDTPKSAIRSMTNAGQRVGVEIPRGLFGKEDAVRRLLDAAKAAGADAALCGNIGAIAPAREAGLTPIGGFGLNVFNRQALAFFAERGLSEATVSPELTFAQIAALSPAQTPFGIFLYGRQPLMLTRNCPRRCAGGSCDTCRHQGITDRTGTAFPVMCDGGCAEVLNSVPLYWADRWHEVPPAAFYLLHFTTETPAKVSAVLQAHRDGATPPVAFTRGLYRRGVQ